MKTERAHLPPATDDDNDIGRLCPPVDAIEYPDDDAWHGLGPAVRARVAREKARTRRLFVVVCATAAAACVALFLIVSGHAPTPGPAAAPTLAQSPAVPTPDQAADAGSDVDAILALIGRAELDTVALELSRQGVVACGDAQGVARILDARGIDPVGLVP